MASSQGNSPSPANTNPNTLTLLCRAVDLQQMDPNADNVSVVYAVAKELVANPAFDTNSVQPSAQISPVDPNTGTFTFTITVAPASPLNM
jgi:hypothetical protein